MSTPHFLTPVFKQKYYGNLTFVPRFTTLQIFGLKSLVNPTVADMEIYLQNGQIAAWPFLHVLKEMLRIERCIDACLAKLEQRIHSVASGHELPMSKTNDDVDSLSSAIGATYRARLPGLGREAELLKEKVHNLEKENVQLRMQVLRLQRALGISHSNVAGNGEAECVAEVLEGRFVSVSRANEDETFEEEVDCLEEMKVT